MLYQLLVLLVPFVTAPYLSRVLEPDGIGIVSFTVSVQSYFIMFAVLGTTGYGTRQIAMYRNDKKMVSKIFWEIELLVLTNTTFVLLLWFIFIYFTKQYSIYYLILSLGILSVVFDISWFYSGIEDFKTTILKNSIVKILSIILIFTFVNEKSDLWIYILLFSLSTFIGNITLWIGLNKKVHLLPFELLNPYSHFRATIEFFIPTIAISVYLVLDKVLIGLITNNPFQNGYYEQAHKVVAIAKSLTFASVNTVLGSRIAYLFSEKQFDKIKKHIAKSIDLILFIGVGLTFGIMSVADLFVPLFFGNGYEEVVTLLVTLSPIIIFSGISSCIGTHYFTPFGLLKIANKIIITGAVINLLFNLVFIPWFGALGAIWGTIIAEGIIAILFVKFDDHYLSFGDIFSKIYKKIISAVVMLLFVKLLSVKLFLSWYGLIALTGFAILVYLTALLLLKDSSVNVLIRLVKEKFLHRR